LKREPEDEVKTKADEVLRGVYGGYAGPRHYHLVGNHDWTKKSLSWNTSTSLKWVPYVTVMDEPRTWAEPQLNFAIHALPADHKFDFSRYQVDPTQFNIFTFHDAVRGCYLDDDSKMLADFGVYRNEIDRSEFDYVFAGDIHIPQRLPFSNTQGGYVGAVIQRTMADANKSRGWVEVEAVWTDTGWDVRTEFVPTRNFFTKASFEVTGTSVYEDIRIDEQWLTDQYVEVGLIGEKSNVDRIANDPRWANYETYYTVRHLELARTYKMEEGEVIVDMSTSSGLLEDLGAYLDSGFAELGTLPREGVTQAVAEMMKED
jgi:DNA repair exonuclease SbcCD nuclease subunit